jgi:glyoxylase-like metal-dependent hydrolase (beta-lactamase superfamily II)
LRSFQKELNVVTKQIVPGVYAIPLGPVNAFLIDEPGNLTLIDTGIPNSSQKILQAVQEIGRRPADVRHILVTHCHTDHSGSLAELKQATGAPAYMHPADAAMVRLGRTTRPMTPSPGLIPRLMVALFMRAAPTTILPTAIEYEVNDGAELPVAGGIKAIHAPGHCAGQLVFLWPRHGGVLFAADTASHMIRLGFSFIYEDLAEGQRSLTKVASQEFEVACFGHGSAIVGGAANQFRQKFG